MEHCIGPYEYFFTRKCTNWYVYAAEHGDHGSPMTEYSNSSHIT